MVDFLFFAVTHIRLDPCSDLVCLCTRGRQPRRAFCRGRRLTKSLPRFFLLPRKQLAFLDSAAQRNLDWERFGFAVEAVRKSKDVGLGRSCGRLEREVVQDVHNGDPETAFGDVHACEAAHVSEEEKSDVTPCFQAANSPGQIRLPQPNAEWPAFWGYGIAPDSRGSSRYRSGRNKSGSGKYAGWR